VLTYETISFSFNDFQFVQSLKEEIKQKEMQLSQAVQDLQTLESELQQTRHTMYSEQAHMANLQAQVRHTTHSSYHLQRAGLHNKSTGSGMIYNSLVIPCTVSRLT
jgi:FtsZ-binding cell division protein ZapB